MLALKSLFLASIQICSIFSVNVQCQQSALNAYQNSVINAQKNYNAQVQAYQAAGGSGYAGYNSVLNAVIQQQNANLQNLNSALSACNY